MIDSSCGTLLGRVVNQMLFFTFIVGVFLMTKMVSYSLDENTYECSLSEFHVSLYMVGLLITRGLDRLLDRRAVFRRECARSVLHVPSAQHPFHPLVHLEHGAALYLRGLRPGQHIHHHGGVVFVEYYFHFFKAFHKKPLLDLNEYWPLSRLNIASPDHTVEQLFECDEELEAVQNRLGVFILIVLGESMIQLLIPSFDLAHKDQMVFLTIMGLLF